MHRIALAHLSAAGLSPPNVVRLARELGCEGVTIYPGVSGTDVGAEVYRLDTDPALRRETAQALAETGVTLELVDALMISPGFSRGEAETQLDIFGELGARLFSVATLEPDRARYLDNLEILKDAADARGLILAVEFYRLFGGLVPSLAAAVDLVTSDRFRGLKIVVDTLHLARAGETPADLAAIDPALIGAAQINDGQLAWPGEEAYLHEAIFERGLPGTGEFPLADFLAVIPKDMIVSPEVPLKSLRDAGVPVEECARRGIEATRRLMAR